MTVESFYKVPKCVEKLHLNELGIDYDEIDLKVIFRWIRDVQCQNLVIGKKYQPHSVDNEVNYLGKGQFAIKLKERNGRVPAILYDKVDQVAAIQFYAASSP